MTHKIKNSIPANESLEKAKRYIESLEEEAAALKRERDMLNNLKCAQSELSLLKYL